MASLRPITRTSWLPSPTSKHTTIATLLSPFLTQFQQCRQASVLSSLSDNAGAYNKRIRRGRGPASGKGKTSGRGHKGQKQHGKVPAGFNGGQTSDEVVHGSRGFENIFSQDLAALNLSRIQKWIASGRLDPSKPITIRELVASNCISSVKDGVKLLSRQNIEHNLTTPIQIVVSRASASAIAAVEKAGGQVLTRFYSPSSLKRILRGDTHPFHSLQSQPLPALGQAAVETPEQALERKAREMAGYKYRLADATGRKDIEYYRDEAHRGYLSHLVPDGHGPSLFFKSQGQLAAGDSKRQQSKKGSAKAENKIW